MVLDKDDNQLSGDEWLKDELLGRGMHLNNLATVRGTQIGNGPQK